jgi:hypothetical protein
MDVRKSRRFHLIDVIRLVLSVLWRDLSGFLLSPLQEDAMFRSLVARLFTRHSTPPLNVA